MKPPSYKSIVVLILLLVSGSGYGQVKDKTFNMFLNAILTNKVKHVSVEEVTKSKVDYTFVDAREVNEYNVSHLKNSIFVGYDDFSMEGLKNIPKDRPIIVYCSVGKRSEKITAKLKKSGYRNVSNLYGGIFEWVNQDHPVYDLQNKQTMNVHAFNKFWGRFVDKGNKVY
ncbi:MAG: rhodanese-like domain-containing protein [Ferruginibacter sp.]